MDEASKRKIQLIKDQAEIQKWSRIKRKTRPRFYLLYSLLIVCLAYIVDELATNINGFVQDHARITFFGGDLSQYTIVMTLCSSIAIFSFFFRALADKYGRKPFLFINVFGMAIGMLFCFLATNVIFYIIGLVICFFFAPCDIQVLYVIETSSDKRRAINLSITKAIAILGITIIPLFQDLIHIKGWQDAFLIPAIVGFVIGFLALFFVKESEVFLDCKISMLEDRVRTAKKYRKITEKKKEKDTLKSGIIPAIKYMFKNKVFLWLFLTMFVFALGSLAAANFDVILQDPSYAHIAEEIIQKVKLHYPFACAITILASGIVSDLFGRRIASIFDVSITALSIIFFIVSVRFSWHFVSIGVFLGCFIGGYLSGLDTLTIMSSEQSPTNMRSSLMSVISISISAGTFVGTAILLMFDNLLDNLDVGLLIAIVIPPAIVLALIILLLKIPETKGASLDALDKKEHAKIEKQLKKVEKI